jgi:adenylate cyclase
MEEPELSEEPPDELTEQWRQMLTGTHPSVLRMRRFNSHLPASPRCKFCLAPFGGIGGAIMRPFGFRPWDGNPNLCTNCFQQLRRGGIGGAEVPTTIFFADVRNSTTLAEGMSPGDFSRLMQRFYVAASAELADHLAIIDKFVGDGAIGLFVPGLTGEAHARRAIEAAQGLLRRVGNGSADGPWLPLGIGINTGVTFVGTVGVGTEVKDITALGDPVNTAARLSGAAAAGEILIAESTAQSAGIDPRGLEHRELQLKGKTEAVGAYVLHATDVTSQGVAA